MGDIPRCCKIPVPHPLGVYVGFADPPSFEIPFGCFGVELMVHRGPGTLIGETKDPDTAPTGRGVIVTFTKVVITKYGEHVLKLNYSKDGQPYSILTRAFMVGNTNLPPPTSLSLPTVATAAATISAIVSSKRQTTVILSEVEAKVSKWLVSANVILPIQESAFVPLRDSVISIIAAEYECPDHRDSIQEIVDKYIAKLKIDNGTAASKITMLAAGVEIPSVPSISPQVFDKIISDSSTWSTYEFINQGVRALGVFVKVSDAAEAKGGLDINGIVVSLPPSIKIPGGTVKISAHTLVLSSNNTTVDVSGSPGQSGIGGCQTATPGKDGSPGEDGQDAGQIIINCNRIIYKNETKPSSLKARIRLIAKGGNAGRGQDGGNGLKGTSGTVGRNGCRGGRGGNGGPSGIPGAGGRISFTTVHDYPNISFSSNSNSGDVAEPSLGGVGGPGGNPGPRTITPKHTTSGYFFVSHSITEELGPKRDQGDPGPPGSRGQVHPPPPNRIAIRQRSPAAYLWGHLIPVPVVGRFIQWTEHCYQNNESITLPSLLLISSILSAQAANGRPVSQLSQRVSLLLKQHTSGYTYWGYRHNYHPLQSFQDLRNQFDDLLWSYEKIWKANNKNELAKSKRKVEKDRLEAVRQTSRTLHTGRSAVRKQLVQKYEQTVSKLEQYTASLQASVSSLSELSEDLTTAIYSEAVNQTSKQLSHAAYQESVSRSLTLLATFLSVYPSLPPSPSVISHLVAQGRELHEATSAYYNVLQESLFGLAGQGINFARDYLLTDTKTLQTKTEEALSQIIAESQADKISMPVHEIDRWVGGMGLKDSNGRVRDAYLSEIRNYARLQKEIEETVTEIETIVKELEGNKSEEEQFLGEDKIIAQTLLQIEWESLDNSTNDDQAISEQCTRVRKQLACSLHVLLLALQRELLRTDLLHIPCSVSSPVSALCTLSKFDSLLLKNKLHRESSVVVEEHGAINFTTEKLLHDLNTAGSCIFGIGPNDHVSLSDKPSMSIESVDVTTTPELPATVTLTHLGRGGTIFNFDMRPVKFTHPAVNLPLGETIDPNVSPFSLFRLTIPWSEDIASLTEFSVKLTTRRNVFT